MSQHPGPDGPANRDHQSGWDPQGAHGQYGPPPTGDYGQYGQPPAGQQYGPPPTGDYGQYGQPPAGQQYGPPPAGDYGQYGQYGAPAGGGYYGGGFVPVPSAVQPGIIPLRPLTLAEIYDGAFRAIRSNPMVMFGLAIIVVGAGAVLQLGFAAVLLTRFEQAMMTGAQEFDAIFSIGALAGVLLSSLAVSLATLILNGLAILSVSESVIGRKISLGEVWQRAKGKIWRLIGLSLLMGLAALLAVIAVVVVIVLVALAVVNVLGEDALVLLLLIPLLLLALGLLVSYVAIRIMLATCVIMLEHTGVFASIRRSWQLTRGTFWRLFGIMLLTTLLVGILVTILSVPFQMFGSIFSLQGGIVVPLIITSLGQLVGSALSIPVMAAVLALLYIDVRMRKEGLDVELARAAQGG